MNRRAYLIVLILAVLAAGVFAIRPAAKRSLCDNLSCIRMDGSANFTRKELYSDTDDTYRALYAHGTRLLRIEAIRTPKENAKTDMDASVARMKALFEKAPAPYPGDISDAVVCDPAFVPEHTQSERNGNTISYFVGYLNDRLTFGSCSADQATHRGIMAFTYCRERGLLLRVELIGKTDDFTANEKQLTDTILGLTCVAP